MHVKKISMWNRNIYKKMRHPVKLFFLTFQKICQIGNTLNQLNFMLNKNSSDLLKY